MDFESMQRFVRSAPRRKCPNCGNTNPETIETNGLNERHPDLTLLCCNRVSQAVTSIDVTYLEPKDFDKDGKVECGWQWEPNSGAGIPDSD